MRSLLISLSQKNGARSSKTVGSGARSRARARSTSVLAPATTRAVVR